MASPLQLIQSNSLNYPPTHEWCCIICTYLNKPNASMCELCLTVKPIASKNARGLHPQSMPQIHLSLNSPPVSSPSLHHLHPSSQPTLSNTRPPKPKRKSHKKPPKKYKKRTKYIQKRSKSIIGPNTLPLPNHKNERKRSKSRTLSNFFLRKKNKQKQTAQKPKLHQSNELITEHNIATVKAKPTHFLSPTFNANINISLPRSVQLYKLPAEKHKIVQNKGHHISQPSNFGLGSAVYTELENVFKNRVNRNNALPALEMYEERMQKHESVLLQTLKCDNISDAVILTVCDARCDVLCHFLPLIAFTLIHNNNNNNEIKWKLLNKLRDRIIGQSDLRQAVTFLVRSYEDIECVQSMFRGLCLGCLGSDSSCEFWYELLNKKRLKENDTFVIPQNVILRDPVKQLCSPIRRVVINKIINSNSKPLLLSCFGGDLSKNTEYLSSTFILKGGDDLRKDKACMLVFKWINHLFSNDYELNNIRILTYNVIPMSQEIGCIQLINDCIPLRDIVSLKSDIGNNQKLLNNLINTSVGSYIGSYLVGVRDRHFDNILIRKTDCTLFHIDMNYVLGDTINGLDANKFGLTKDFYELLGKENYDRFVNLACEAFVSLRHHYQELINFACLSFSYVYQYKIIKKYIEKQLRMSESDQKSIQWLKVQLKNAPFNKHTKLKNVIHKFATR